MKHAIARKITHYLINFFYIQLCITLFSLPILVVWGLPFSIMSPVGNLLFAPFLVVFLFLSSLIFFTEILFIPNGFIIYLLESTSKIWLSILHYGSNTWLISFAKPHALFFPIVALIGIFLFHHKKFQALHIKCSALGLLLLCTVLLLKQNNFNKNHHFTIACNNGSITVLRNKNKTIVIDPGYLGQRYSSFSFVEYTLLQELNKECGSQVIDHLVLLHPGKQLFDIIESLYTYTTIKNLYFPYWTGKGSPSFLRSYGKLKRAAEKNNSTIIRLGRYPKKITDLTHPVTITPLAKNTSYQTIQYPLFEVQAKTNNQNISIHSKNKLPAPNPNNE